MADNTPVADPKDPAISAPTAVLQPEATTEDIIPEFAKGTEAIAEEPAVVEAPVSEEEQAVDRRLSKAISDVERRNEEVRKMVDLQADIVKDNNDLIHKIAASDPNLANQIVTKVWGTQGIKSYKQLLERSKLEELKAENPEAYETKRDLMEVKAKLADREARDQAQALTKFLKSEGIQQNEYDPNYRNLMSNLEALNPEIVSTDYEKALKLARAMTGEIAPVRVEAPTLPMGGGNRPAPLPTSKPQFSEQTNWLADSLNKKFGYKISI